MIKLKVDEGYAMDYLAILEIKAKKKINESCEKAYSDCLENVSEEIGGAKISEILNSPEYKNLKEANEKTFDAVELARYGETTAKNVDDCNMKRFLCKKALIEKFFPKSTQVESKS